MNDFENIITACKTTSRGAAPVAHQVMLDNDYNVD